MLNNACERSEPRKCCILNHQIWKNNKFRTLFFLPIVRGANVPSPPPPPPPPESATGPLIAYTRTVPNIDRVKRYLT